MEATELQPTQQVQHEQLAHPPLDYSLQQQQLPQYDQPLVLPPLDYTLQPQQLQPAEYSWQQPPQQSLALQPYSSTAYNGDPSCSNFMPQFNDASIFPLPTSDANFTSQTFPTADSIDSHTSTTASSAAYTPNFSTFPDFSSTLNYAQPLNGFDPFNSSQLPPPFDFTAPISAQVPAMGFDGTLNAMDPSAYFNALVQKLEEIQRQYELLEQPLNDDVDPYEAPPAAPMMAPPPDENPLHDDSSSDAPWNGTTTKKTSPTIGFGGMAFRVPAPEVYSAPPVLTVVQRLSLQELQRQQEPQRLWQPWQQQQMQLQPDHNSMNGRGWVQPRQDNRNPGPTDLWTLTGDLDMMEVPPEDPKNIASSWLGHNGETSATAVMDESEVAKMDYNAEASGSLDQVVPSPWIPQNRNLHQLQPPPKQQPQQSDVKELLNSAVSCFPGGQRQLIMGLIDTISQLNDKTDKVKKKFHFGGTARFNPSSLARCKQPAIFQFPGKNNQEVMLDVGRSMGDYTENTRPAKASLCSFVKHIMEKVYADPCASLRVTAGCDKSTKGYRIVPESSIKTLAKFWQTHFVTTSSHNTKDIFDMMTLTFKNYLDKYRSEMGKSLEKEEKEATEK